VLHDSPAVPSCVGAHATPSDSGTLVEEFIELPNGCICCTVKDRRGLELAGGVEGGLTVSPPCCRSFLQTLEALLLKRDRFDYLLVETTGARLRARTSCRGSR
jgi:hypothetical protein